MKQEIINKAYHFSLEKHKNQKKDDSGHLYFYAHILPVAQIIERITFDENIIAAAYLHDTIEDTDTTYEELKKVFGQKIADLVNELTHEGQKDEYGYYFPRLKSKEAILIKFADRLSNLSRMESWDEERQAQYLKKSKFWKGGQPI